MVNQISPFSMSEYYSWRKIHKVSSWGRAFQPEFLRHEVAQIKKSKEWYFTFLKKPINCQLDEALFYTVPVEIDSSWRAAISTKGNYNYVGLSCIKNCPEIVLIALFPFEIKQPSEYQLINLVKSKKIVIENQKRDIMEYALIVEDWYPVNSDKVYHDIKVEPNVVQKLLKQNLSIYGSNALSFQSPLMSSPYVKGSVGGISLSSFSSKSSFAQELLRTLQLMVPPEYRSILPPQSAIEGGDYEHLPGLKFHFSECLIPTKDHFTSQYENSYSGIYQELENRKKYPGEYSIFSTIGNPEGNTRENFKELMINFTETEVTLPESLDSIKSSDVDLTRLKQDLNEDTWIQIAQLHQINPTLDFENDQNFRKSVDRLKIDFDALLSDSIREDSEKEAVIRNMISPLQGNLKRLSQSLSRSCAETHLEQEHFDSARGLIVDNFSGFISSPEFKRMNANLKRANKNACFSAVETEILMNKAGGTTFEIYNSINQKLFRDIYELQDLLDWMRMRGYIILDINKKYHWVGKPVDFK